MQIGPLVEIITITGHQQKIENLEAQVALEQNITKLK